MNEIEQKQSERRATSPAEYQGGRDMDLFWAEVKPKREPMERWWYLPTVLAIVVLSVPWYWETGTVGKIIGGLPVWVWITVVCSLAISSLTAWVALRHWDDDEPAGRGK